MLQLHLVHLVASNQLQHAEAVTILGTKLGAVLLLQADGKSRGKIASQQPDIKPSFATAAYPSSCGAGPQQNTLPLCGAA